MPIRYSKKFFCNLACPLSDLQPLGVCFLLLRPKYCGKNESVKAKSQKVLWFPQNYMKMQDILMIACHNFRLCRSSILDVYSVPLAKLR